MLTGIQKSLNFFVFLERFVELRHETVFTYDCLLTKSLSQTAVVHVYVSYFKVHVQLIFVVW